MVEWWLIQGDIPVIREATFFNFLSRTRDLVESQRKALRTGSKKGIAECKARERALLDYVGKYEAYRIQMLQACKDSNPNEQSTKEDTDGNNNKESHQNFTKSNQDFRY
mgnify:CR=1 FL=1